jgi:trehalose/maltose hydrolase-like predicted phosphorylase
LSDRPRDYIVYLTFREPLPMQTSRRGEWAFWIRSRARAPDLLASQEQYMGDILRRSDVQGTSVKRRTVSPAGDPLRRLSQARARADDTDAAVKGLTGQAHEGHYFRVTESYLLTFPICTTRHAARFVISSI